MVTFYMGFDYNLFKATMQYAIDNLINFIQDLKIKQSMQI